MTRRKFKEKFTDHDVETAVRILIESHYVRNWIEGEAKAFGLSLDSLEGLRFRERRSRELAEKLIQ